MEMCYAGGALVMPSNFAVMSEEEMMYTEGGITIPIKPTYSNKNICRAEAWKYVSVTGLSQMRIAKEIYAHAFLYYASNSVLKKFSKMTLGAVSYATLVYIKAHANPITLGGDSAFRVAVYNAIWKFC